MHTYFYTVLINLSNDITTNIHFDLVTILSTCYSTTILTTLSSPSTSASYCRQ